MRPSIGRIVIYRSRTGDYDVPAIIAATADSLFAPNVEAGYIPALSSDTHVHLVVFSPGPSGKRADATDFKVESAHGRSENQGGIYAEWDIPFAESEDHDHSQGLYTPGTWRWPERVA
jgi:hypothetical protein